MERIGKISSLKIRETETFQKAIGYHCRIVIVEGGGAEQSGMFVMLWKWPDL